MNQRIIARGKGWMLWFWPWMVTHPKWGLQHGSDGISHWLWLWCVQVWWDSEPTFPARPLKNNQPAN